MTERPILMSTPMVRALLAGTKTQTRRVVKDLEQTARYHGVEPDGKHLFSRQHIYGKTRCPYGQPGDRLWVREAWRAPAEFDRVKPSDLRAPSSGLLGTPIVHEASRHESVQFGKLRPSMFMPRWASRISLEITGVRVERLQDISDDDALAEGVDRTNTSIPGHARERYRVLWESINGAGSWEANPWVWVVEFRAVTLGKDQP